MEGKRSWREKATPLQCVMCCEEWKTVFHHCDHRQYKLKTQRQSWNEDNMEKAPEAVAAGMGKKTAVQQFGVPVMTLKRRAFSTNINATSHLKILGSNQLADRNGIAHNYSHQNKAAGKDWLRDFRLRHPQMPLRLPEYTSVDRAMRFK
ncbi:hypothetical protein PR048_026501 [Dryococelus australis]|uniref:Uncharacterized protein n=1 Tax=Dryococelus australis TaxID=614101 RepID=A0ABQ9GLK0_9NEOP|nr:hypothetical protein PR048_026501 [Dryococelus australis]